MQFMGKKVIPSLIKVFNDNNYDYNKVDKDGGFDYLIAFNGNIFRIACDLSFFQANHGTYGIGSGGQLALGYLYSICKPDMELDYAKRHARKAVEIASVLDANTGKPGAKCPENAKRIPLISTNGSACVSCGLCVFGKADVRFSATKK